ncbi:hypothetical protein [Bathymodiolus platifrons methanotrophic gill symbiont]|uniref:hypothetical protein n=1 Tax=Bathymodiolus platifrons methanotrophic gill symbiont TaxID=113268 RepID=UPI000B411CAA|nr:hypothetical protein [Bathymodiolus platifrons methanotrophic gill symbiont]
MNTDLTQEENEIIEYIESGNAKSIKNINNEISKYTNMASDFDEFLREDGILADTESIAIKRVTSYQLEQKMNAQKITKNKNV